jgi:hypothetical protein
MIGKRDMRKKKSVQKIEDRFLRPRRGRKEI